LQEDLLLNFRRLEVTGFKSFADKVELAFEPGITAVVGPNGCGKSNIADAIKWALGEQNAKALRCDKMEDLIFNGGSSRRQLGMSQVSLVMLNTDGNIDTEYKEIEVERRFFRSGESEYYINRNRCLLKDIHEIFMDTGLGINSYSIMEQGHIDLILNSNPQDRRLIIEEAAGITKYRHRKKTTLRKLEATEQNLLRISDILHELEQQVASLKRQESRARTYQRYYTELKTLDTALSRRRYDNLAVELKNSQSKITVLDDKAGSISANNAKLEAELETLRLEIAQLDTKLADIRNQERKIQSNVEETESNIAVLKERRGNLQQQQQRLTSEVAKNTQRIEQLDEQVSKLAGERNNLSEAISKQESELKEAQTSADKLSQSTAEAEKATEELKAQVIDSLNRKSRIQNELSATNSRLDYLTNRRDRLTTDAESFRNEFTQLEENLDRLQNELDEKEEKIRELVYKEQQVNSEIEKMRSVSSSLEKKIRELEQRRNTRSSRLQSLQELQKAHEGYGAGVKAILKTQNTKDQPLKGICGAVAELIRTEAQYELAIEASLGSNIQSIVTETIEDAKKALEYLIERKTGRANFLPMDYLKIYDTVQENDILAIASQVVIFDPKYAIVVNFLLANTFIVQDIETAIRLSESARKSSNNVQFVTLDGQLVSSAGNISGGTGTESAGLLRRSREIADLEKEVNELDNQLGEVYKERDEVISKNSTLQRERDRVTKEIQSERITHTGMQKDKTQYKQRLERLEKEISVLDSEYSTLDKEIADLQQNKAKLSADAEVIEKKSDAIKADIDKLQSETRQKIQERDAMVKVCTDLRIQLASKKQQEKGLAENLGSLEKEKDQLVKTLSSYQDSAQSNDKTEQEVSENIITQEAVLEKTFTERTKIEAEIGNLESQRQKIYVDLSQKETLIRDNRRELDIIKNDRYQLEVSRTQVQMNVDALIAKMRERYGISLVDSEQEVDEGTEKTQDSELTEEEIESRIEDLRTKMDKLGPVNLTAVDEYNQQKARYDLMITQREDLIKAKESLYSIIQRINTESRERMRTTFEAVNASFQELFQRLFGGGHGELLMVGEGDVLESGVEIIARPPGKKPQTISMLSSGERSLTAIALLFALFKIKPSPFCVMDEVDAALDDSNVARFAGMLKEFSQDIQFIIITHNKRTMEIADILYGVTMEEAGVSKLVSLRM
jgi:chromosome segregation protein